MYKLGRSRKYIISISNVSHKIVDAINVTKDRSFCTHINPFNKWSNETIEYYSNLSISHSRSDVKFVDTYEQKNVLKKEICQKSTKAEDLWSNDDIDHYHNLSVIHSKNN